PSFATRGWPATPWTPPQSRPTTPTTWEATSTAARPTCASCWPVRRFAGCPTPHPTRGSSSAPHRRRPVAECTACAAGLPPKLPFAASFAESAPAVLGVPGRQLLVVQMRGRQAPQVEPEADEEPQPHQ